MEWNQIQGLFLCFTATVFWGLSCFSLNLKDYVDPTGATLEDDPSLVLMATGMMLSFLVFLAFWPQLPFKMLSGRQATMSWTTGLFYGIATSAYYVLAASGMSASLLGPLSGAHILVPPLFGVIRGKGISMKALGGFTCSIACVVSISGILPGSPVDDTLDGGDPGQAATWTHIIGVAVMVFGWGIGMLVQDEVGGAITYFQFPQSHGLFALGYSCAVIPLAMTWETGFKEMLDRQNWQLRLPQVIMVGSSCLSGIATGLFTACLNVFPNLNLMVALSSLYVTIPAVFGILFLHEPASWNVFLGLCFALAGAGVLSMEVTDEKEGGHPVKDIEVPLLSAPSAPQWGPEEDAARAAAHAVMPDDITCRSMQVRSRCGSPINIPDTFLPPIRDGTQFVIRTEWTGNTPVTPICGWDSVSNAFATYVSPSPSPTKPKMN